jgi:hypothetical protein
VRLTRGRSRSSHNGKSLLREALRRGIADANAAVDCGTPRNVNIGMLRMLLVEDASLCDRCGLPSEPDWEHSTSVTSRSSSHSCNDTVQLFCKDLDIHNTPPLSRERTLENRRGAQLYSKQCGTRYPVYITSYRVASLYLCANACLLPTKTPKSPLQLRCESRKRGEMHLCTNRAAV